MKSMSKFVDDFVKFIEFLTQRQIPTFKHCIIIGWLCVFTPWLMLNTLIHKLLNSDLLNEDNTSLIWINDEITFYNNRYKRPIIIFYDILFFMGTLFHISFLLWINS